MFIFICVLRLHMYLCFFIFFNDPNFCFVCISLVTCVSPYIEFLSPFVSSFVHLAVTVWPSTFFEKSDCYKMNLKLSVISIITIYKLLQIIWGYITSFVVCQFFCLSLYLYLWKMCMSHYNGVMSYMSHFIVTCGSSLGEAVKMWDGGRKKKSKFKVISKFKRGAILV